MILFRRSRRLCFAVARIFPAVYRARPGAEGHPPNLSILPSPRRRRGEIRSAPLPLLSPRKPLCWVFAGPQKGYARQSRAEKPVSRPSSLIPRRGGDSQAGVCSPLEERGKEWSGWNCRRRRRRSGAEFLPATWRFDGAVPHGLLSPLRFERPFGLTALYEGGTQMSTRRKGGSFFWTTSTTSSGTPWTS